MSAYELTDKIIEVMKMEFLTYPSPFVIKQIIPIVKGTNKQGDNWTLLLFRSFLISNNEIKTIRLMNK